MKLSLFLVLMPMASHAASTVSPTWIINAPIPDNSPIGLSSSRSVVSQVTQIQSVEVYLDISGGWAGDLYAYLAHGSGFSVLLNRPGRTSSLDEGSGAMNLLITISGSGLSDIHTGLPLSGSVTGVFQPDGRNLDPGNSLDTSPRTALLDSFNGLDANGEWTLYIADVVAGDTMTLNSWSLQVTGVPEPTTATLLAAGALGLLRRRRPTT